MSSGWTASAEDWAQSENGKLNRYWAELLRRSLLQRVKPRLRWHQKRALFYFPSPEPPVSLAVEGPTAYGRWSRSSTTSTSVATSSD